MISGDEIIQVDAKEAIRVTSARGHSRLAPSTKTHIQKLEENSARGDQG